MGKEGKHKKAKKSKEHDDEAPAQLQDGAAHQMQMMAPQMMMGMPAAMHPQQYAMMMGMRPVAMGPRGGMGMPPMMMPTMGMPGASPVGFPPPAPFAPRGSSLAVGHARRSKRPPSAPARPEATPALVVEEITAASSSSSSSTSSSSSSKPEDGEAPPVVLDDHTEAAAENNASVLATSDPVDIAPRTPPDRPDSEPLVTAPLAAEPQGSPVLPTGGMPTAPAVSPGAEEPIREEEPREEAVLKRPPPKRGKISFNLQGGAIAAAQAKVQVKEAYAAAVARRLNTKDASTQTVRDPEHQDGEIVTIWRLRKRGMESFPHFPKAVKKKAQAREPMICCAADEEVAAVVNVKQAEPQKPGRKRPLQLDAPGIAPEKLSESPAGSRTGVAGQVMEEATQQLVAADSDDEDDSAASDDALQEALARTVNRASNPALYMPSS